MQIGNWRSQNKKKTTSTIFATLSAIESPLNNDVELALDFQIRFIAITRLLRTRFDRNYEHNVYFFGTRKLRTQKTSLRKS